MKQKILFLSHTDSGGAGKANVNIAKALISIGNEVQFLVAKKTTNEDFITQIDLPAYPVIHSSFLKRNLNRFIHLLGIKKTEIRPKIKYVDEYCYYNEDEKKSYYEFGDILPYISIKPTIVIGGWISFFINLETLGQIASHFKALPFVQMNDMAHLTGGCHYNYDCLGYTKNCANCPALEENTNKDQSLINLQNKKKSIEKYNIQIIAGSENNIAEARNSTLYKNQKEIKSINGIIDFDLFNDKKREIAKQVFDIQKNKKIVLSGASSIKDPRKGFDKLQKSLYSLNELLIEQNKEIIYIIVGSANDFEYDFSNIEVRKMESVSNKLIFSLLYQAADVFASPSVQDTGPVMVIEALACGTPVVAYEIGFAKTFVWNGDNGFVIPDFDTLEFATKIFDILFKPGCLKTTERSVTNVKNSFSAKQFENFLSF